MAILGSPHIIEASKHYQQWRLLKRGNAIFDKV
jgi:hypothetical protein